MGWFSLWLREAVRVASVVKAVVKWALAWSARGQAAGQGLGWLGVGVAALGVVQVALALLADGRLSPLAALGLSDTERHALACSFPKVQRVGEGGWFPRWRAVKWW